MPTAGDVTVTVTYPDGAEETYLVAAADAANIVKGDVVIKFKGKKTSGTPDSVADDYEFTRAQIRKIKFHTN